MTRSFNDFRNRRQRAGLTHGVRPLMALEREDVDGWGRWFAIAAMVLLILGIVLRSVGTELSERAVRGVQFNMENPDAVAESLRQIAAASRIATDWFLFAGALTLLGFVFAWSALVKKRYRASWSLPVFIILAFLHLPLTPVGTLVGIASLWYLFLRRHEFSPPKPVIPVSP